MILRTRTCNFCATEYWAWKYKCPRCGTVYQEPRKSKKQIIFGILLLILWFVIEKIIKLL